MIKAFLYTTSWAPRRCPGLFHNLIVKKSRADWSKGPAGFGLGWAPHKFFLYNQTHPEEQLMFAGPRPILKAYTPIW
jgi:hypothetical protein